MRTFRLLAALLVLAGLSACNHGSTFTVDGPLRIRTGGASVRLENTTPQPVYVFVVERESAAVIDWMPCVNPDECDGIAPGTVRTLRYDEVSGYEEGEREAIVYWWHVVHQPGGGWAAETIHSESIRL